MLAHIFFFGLQREVCSASSGAPNSLHTGHPVKRKVGGSKCFIMLYQTLFALFLLQEAVFFCLFCKFSNDCFFYKGLDNDLGLSGLQLLTGALLKRFTLPVLLIMVLLIREEISNGNTKIKMHFFFFGGRQ